MANNEIKTNAEIYREQRKERLQKAAKKKHSAKKDKIVRILVKTLAIVLTLSLVLVFAGNLLLNVFGVPQRVLTVSEYDGKKLSGAEYNYYYMVLYNQITNMSYTYESNYQSYGSGYGVYFTGFDYTKDPAEQEYPYDDAPEGVETWSDYFKEMATIRGFLMSVMYENAMSDEAEKAGFKLSDDELKEINDSIDENVKTLSENAVESDYSLTNFISRTQGEGLNEKSYRELQKRDAIAQKYLEWYQTYKVDDYTDEEVEKYFNENKNDFIKASARIFAVSYAEPAEDSNDPAYTKEQAKARAEQFRAAITSESKFIELSKQYCLPSQKEAYENDSATLLKDVSYSDVSTSENVAKWIFDSNRKSGETTVIEDEESKTFTIVYIIYPAKEDNTAADNAVRHILFEAQTTTTDDENNEVELSQEVIDANFAKAKAEAEKVLDEYNAGKKNEESFTALVKQYSQDPGAATNEGLYSDVAKDGTYVEEFTNWAIDPTRKPGDVEIIKTEFGYHIMYYVSANKYTGWQKQVRDTMASNDYNKLVDDSYNSIEETAKTNDTIRDFFAKRLAQTITTNITNAT